MTTHESAQKNRQLGGTLFGFGLFFLLLLPVISWIEPIPDRESLMREQVALASAVRLIEGRGVRAEFTWTDGKVHSYGRIPSLSVCASPEARDLLTSAQPGALLFVEGEPIGDPRNREFEVWALTVNGVRVIDFSASVAAHKSIQRNTFYLSLGMVVVGLPLLILGWRQKHTLEASRSAA